MNVYFIIAGCFLLICLLIHMLVGDKEYCELNPKRNEIDSDRLFQRWLMGRGTFQMVSVDLLLTAIFLILMGIRIVPYHFYLALFIALLYLGYLVFWIGMLIASQAKVIHYLKVGQWLIFFITFILVILGMK